MTKTMPDETTKSSIVRESLLFCGMGMPHWLRVAQCFQIRLPSVSQQLTAQHLREFPRFDAAFILSSQPKRILTGNNCIVSARLLDKHTCHTHWNFYSFVMSAYNIIKCKPMIWKVGHTHTKHVTNATDYVVPQNFWTNQHPRKKLSYLNDRKLKTNRFSCYAKLVEISRWIPAHAYIMRWFENYPSLYLIRT